MNEVAEQKSATEDHIQFSWSTYLPAILIAGLGFFVDVYDVLLFAILRVPSLTDLGVASQDTLRVGVDLMNAQMTGLILGGLVWGIIGDKKGRRASLLGSIIVYSLASIANSFVTSVPVYGLLRFITGFGLAGEVGAAMTTAAEITPARYRTFGTAAISLMGVLGSLLASYVGGHIAWRHAFAIAGVAGLGLLCIRISMKETALFEKAKNSGHIEAGTFRLLFSKTSNILKIMRCVLSALPLFFVFGILVTFAPEITKGGASSTATVAKIAAYYSIGEVVGEVVSGVLSQLLRSRKKTILLFQAGALAFTVAILMAGPQHYATLCLPLGFFVGYWAIAITTTAEQFGTNVRATVTTLVPNLMRACDIPINLLFAAMVTQAGTKEAVIVLAAICFVFGIVSVIFMPETFAKDLDFVES